MCLLYVFNVISNLIIINELVLRVRINTTLKRVIPFLKNSKNTVQI